MRGKELIKRFAPIKSFDVVSGPWLFPSAVFTVLDGSSKKLLYRWTSLKSLKILSFYKKAKAHSSKYYKKKNENNHISKNFVDWKIVCGLIELLSWCKSYSFSD